MFKVEAFVEDKNLASVLRALALVRAYDVKSVPVSNAKATKGVVKQKVEGDPIDHIYEAIKNKSDITATLLKDVVVDLGLARSYGGQIIAKMVKARMIKKGKGGRGKYVVVK